MGNKSSSEYESMRKNIFEKYSPYQILGVSENQSIDEIIPKYKQLLRKYHPDKGGDVKKFILIQNAFTEVLNRQDSKSHDHMKKAYQADAKKIDASMNPSMNTSLRSGKDFDNENFNKMFDDNKMSDVTIEHGYGTVDWSQYDKNKSPKYELKPYEEIGYNVQTNLNGQYLDAKQVSDYSQYPELFSQNKSA